MHVGPKVPVLPNTEVEATWLHICQDWQVAENAGRLVEELDSSPIRQLRQTAAARKVRDSFCVVNALLRSMPAHLHGPKADTGKSGLDTRPAVTACSPASRRGQTDRSIRDGHRRKEEW